MSELTCGQIAILAAEVIGPSPGWNADLEVRLPGGVVTGAEISDLFQRGLLTAVPIAPPHEEEFDENAGSIVLDHIWKATTAILDVRLDSDDRVSPPSAAPLTAATK